MGCFSYVCNKNDNNSFLQPQPEYIFEGEKIDKNHDIMITDHSVF